MAYWCNPPKFESGEFYCVPIILVWQYFQIPPPSCGRVESKEQKNREVVNYRKNREPEKHIVRTPSQPWWVRKGFQRKWDVKNVLELGEGKLGDKRRTFHREKRVYRKLAGEKLKICKKLQIIKLAQSIDHEYMSGNMWQWKSKQSSSKGQNKAWVIILYPENKKKPLKSTEHKRA